MGDALVSGIRPECRHQVGFISNCVSVTGDVPFIHRDNLGEVYAGMLLHDQLACRDDFLAELREEFCGLFVDTLVKQWRTVESFSIPVFPAPVHDRRMAVRIRREQSNAKQVY